MERGRMVKTLSGWIAMLGLSVLMMGGLRPAAAAGSGGVSTNLSLWYDAGDAATITLSAGRISRWNDKSGNGYNLVPQTATGPALATDVIYGKPAARFSGAEVLTANDATANSPIDFKDKFNFFFVLKPTARDIGILFGRCISWGNYQLINLNYDTNGGNPPKIGLYLWDTGSALFSSEPGMIDYTQFQILEVRYDKAAAAGNITFYANGDAKGARDYAKDLYQDNRAMVVGGDVLGNWRLKADVAEYVAFKDALGDADRAKVGSYLANKYHLISSYAGSTTPVGPAGISANLSDWYDASDAASITVSGGKVTQWKDKSANGFDLTPSTAEGPALIANTLNGKPVVRFSGAETLRTSDTRTNSPIDFTDKFNCFAVVKVSGTGYGALFNRSDSNGDYNTWLMNYTAADGQAFYCYPGNVWNFSDAGAIDRNYQILEVQFDRTKPAGNFVFFSNGAAKGVKDWTTALTQDDRPMYVGGGLSTNWRLVGDLAEMILYKDALKYDDRLAIGQFLAEKYGITAYKEPEVPSAVVQRRPMVRETALGAPGAPAAAILVPDEPAYQTLGQQLSDAIFAKTAIRLPVESAAARVSTLNGLRTVTLNSNAILVGQFWNNPVLAALYNRMLDPTDNLFPGPGGWQVRTVCRPFANTLPYNCVVASGSDLAGCQAAATALSERIQNGSIPFQFEVHLTGEAATEEATFRSSVIAYYSDLDSYTIFPPLGPMGHL